MGAWNRMHVSVDVDIYVHEHCVCFTGSTRCVRTHTRAQTHTHSRTHTLNWLAEKDTNRPKSRGLRSKNGAALQSGLGGWDGLAQQACGSVGNGQRLVTSSGSTGVGVVHGKQGAWGTTGCGPNPRGSRRAQTSPMHSAHHPGGVLHSCLFRKSNLLVAEVLAKSCGRFVSF